VRFKDPIRLTDTSEGHSPRWLRRVTALAVVVPLTTTGVLALGELAASAHTTAIKGTAVCDTATGTYSIHWVGDTDLVPANDVAKVDITSHSPAASAVPASPITTTLAPNASYSFTQTGIPGNAGTASVAVHVYWTPTAPGAPNSDTFDAPASGTVVNLPLCNIPLPVVQTLAGHIYLCPANATTTEVAGGTLSASGAQAVASQANPLAPTNVAAGAYTMAAGAPAGYTFVTCGGNAVINGAATGATESLTVPTGGSATGIFYVRQIPPIVQQLAGHIYLCPTTGATTTEVSGGTLGATGAQTVATQANPLPLGDVAAGGYTMRATAPAGYTFVACGTTNQTINPAADAATQALTVPAGGSATGIFYVRQIPPPPVEQQLAGHIYLCPTAGPTTTEVAGGTLGATGVQPVATQANPLAPLSVNAGDYTMSATAPTGYTFVVCSTVPQTINTAGNAATEALNVPSGGSTTGIFYVRQVPPPVTCPAGTTMGANGTCVPPVTCPAGTTMGANGTCVAPVVTPPVGPCPTGTTMNAQGVCARNVVSGGTTGGATGPVLGPVVPPKKPVSAPVQEPAALPFTGSNTGALLDIALLLIVVGGGLMVVTRRQSDFAAPTTG
jgi:hypothetical protein